jgi:hypothetical protein
MAAESFIKEVLKQRPLMALPMFGMVFFFLSLFIMPVLNLFSLSFDDRLCSFFFLFGAFSISALTAGLLNPFSDKEMEERFGVFPVQSSPFKDDLMTNPAYGFMPGNSYHQNYVRNHSSSFHQATLDSMTATLLK